MSTGGLLVPFAEHRMLLRNLLTLVNFATIAVSVGVLLALPQYAGVAFYLLLAWMFASLALIYSPWSNRSIGSGGTGASGPVPAPPLPPGSGHEHSSSIGFCMYCAAPVDPGTLRCPSCGRALPHFA